VVRNFLTYLEKERHSSPATAHQRLTAIRSLFHFVSQCLPELVDLVAQLEALPLRKTILRRSIKKKGTLSSPEPGPTSSDNKPTWRKDHDLMLF